MIQTYKDLEESRSRAEITYSEENIQGMAKQLPKMYNELTDSLKNDPIIHRFVRRQIGSPINHPWEVLGEKRSMAFTLAMIRSKQTNLANPHDDLEYYSLITCLLESIPYYWNNDALKLALSQTVPNHIIQREQFPFPIMYWSFQDALKNLHETRRIDRIDGMLFVDRPNGMSIYDIGSADGQFIVTSDFIPYGKLFDGQNKGVGQILAMLAFINSPYTVTDKQRLTRPERHEQERAKPKHHVQDEVNVVILRRPEPAKSGGNYVGSKKQWNHQWLVNGHIRNQYYPSIHTHKPIWIAPYAKGPKDKPIIPKLYKVKR